MRRLLSLLRRTGAELALALALLPALLLGSSGSISPISARDASPVSRTSGSGGGVVELVLDRRVATEDDDVPDWVWGVGGGLSGTAIVVALGYKFWLERRR